MSIHFLDATSRSCRYPAWGSDERNGFVCGQPSERGSSYCEACTKLVLKRGEKKRHEAIKQPQMAVLKNQRETEADILELCAPQEKHRSIVFDEIDEMSERKFGGRLNTGAHQKPVGYKAETDIFGRHVYGDVACKNGQLHISST